MRIDANVLILLLCISIVLQMIVIFIQSKLTKTFRGINLWLCGNIFIVIGLFLLLFRNLITIKLIAIIFSNMIILLGAILIYIGIVWFLDIKEKRLLISFIFVLFTLFLFYFTYAKDDLAFRIAISSISISSVSIITALELLCCKKSSLRSSCMFLGLLFLFNGTFFAIHALLSLIFTQKNSFFNPSVIQIDVFLVSIIGVYLWSYGLTIMINQKINVERKAALKRFQLIFNTSPDIVFISNLQSGIIVEVNNKFVTAIGYSKGEVINKTTTSLNFWHSEKEREKFITQIKEYGSCENYEVIIQRKDGSFLHGLISATLMDLEGSPHIISVTRDITERKRTEEKIKVLSQAVEQSPVSIVITNTSGDIQYVNKKFIELTGYSFEEVIGKNPRILKSGLAPVQTYKDLWSSVLQGKEWKGEFHNKKKSGELYWESASISPIFNDLGDMIQLLAIKEDITERKHLENELHKQANIDALTGISNRRSFIAAVENELIKNQRYPKQNAFLMLDIDHFKFVNDNFGHATGDIALAKVAKVCNETLRASDIFGRIGGEEFSVFLVETDFTEAQKIAERLRFNVENIQLFDDQGTKVPLQISIGITNFCKEEDTLQTLMVRSDKALYQAKSEGRNRVVAI